MTNKDNHNYQQLETLAKMLGKRLLCAHIKAIVQLNLSIYDIN
jgi:hypothetical protein